MYFIFFGIKFVLKPNINHKYIIMKKSVFLSLIFLLAFSADSFSQKKHHPGHSHHNFSHNQTHSFGGGFLTGFLFGEIFGLGINNSREMYFKYKPHQQTWRLTRDFNKNTIGWRSHKNCKVIARFENPRGGQDFFVTINRNGRWILDCPQKFAKLFKNKVRRNL